MSASESDGEIRESNNNSNSSSSSSSGSDDSSGESSGSGSSSNSSNNSSSDTNSSTSGSSKNSKKLTKKKTAKKVKDVNAHKLNAEKNEKQKQREEPYAVENASNDKEEPIATTTTLLQKVDEILAAAAKQAKPIKLTADNDDASEKSHVEDGELVASPVARKCAVELENDQLEKTDQCKKHKSTSRTPQRHQSQRRRRGKDSRSRSRSVRRQRARSRSTSMQRRRSLSQRRKRSVSRTRQRSISRTRQRSNSRTRQRSNSRTRQRSISRTRQRSRSKDAHTRRSISLERRREERKRRHAEQEKRAADENAEKVNNNHDNATVNDAKAKISERQRRTVDLLTSRTGGAYIPPAKLRLLQAEITDKSSAAYQRIAWEALKKSIHGYINKVNVDNIAVITRELLKENIVRGRGLLCRSIIQAQAASPTFTHVYAALVAIINSKFPNIGELLLKRLIIQFKRAYRRNDKMVCLSSSRFIGHLVNQRVAHEILALQILTLLVETPTDDSVEVAIAFLKEVGMKLTEVSAKGIGAIFEMLKNILHEGKLDKRVQYMIEVVFQVRKDGFKDHQSVVEALELVEEDDQYTHLLMLEEVTQTEDALNVFRFDDQYETNEDKYKGLSKEILGSDSSDAENGSGSDGSDSDSEGGSDTDDEGADGDGKAKTGDIIDNTETNLIALRRTIYLTINSSLDYEECAHKLMRMQLKPGQEVELCHMFLDCCAEQRTYEKFYGLLAQRFCALNKIYIHPFEEIFQDTYQTTHRLDTNRLRNVSKFFAHLLFTDAISWDVLECIKLNEDDTTSSSRIFIKILFQELAEYMGLSKLNAKLKQEALIDCLAELFPKNNPRNTRFAINFFTSIGLGGLTDELRQFLKNAPKSVPAINAEMLNINKAIKAEANSSEEASSSSKESSSSDSSSSSSSEQSSADSSSSDESESAATKSKKRKKTAKDEKNSRKKKKMKSSKKKKKKEKAKARKKQSSSDSGSSSDSESDSSSSESESDVDKHSKGKKTRMKEKLKKLKGREQQQPRNRQRNGHEQTRERADEHRNDKQSKNNRRERSNDRGTEFSRRGRDTTREEPHSRYRNEQPRNHNEHELDKRKQESKQHRRDSRVDNADMDTNAKEKRRVEHQERPNRKRGHSRDSERDSKRPKSSERHRSSRDRNRKRDDSKEKSAWRASNGQRAEHGSRERYNRKDSRERDYRRDRNGKQLRRYGSKERDSVNTSKVY